jgi:hypothetical protein
MERDLAQVQGSSPGDPAHPLRFAGNMGFLASAWAFYEEDFFLISWYKRPKSLAYCIEDFRHDPLRRKLLAELVRSKHGLR